MAELALQLAVFILTVLACVQVLRVFPRFRIHCRRPRVAFLAVALVVVPAGPLVLSARSYDILGAELLPALLLASTLLFSGLGFATLYVAWRADPARGRLRCPKCWYDLSGSQSPVCPECGRQSTERQRARTRRSPRLAVLGAACLILSLAGLKAPQVQQHGWQALIPTTALILSLEHIPGWLLEDTTFGTFGVRFTFATGPAGAPTPAPAPAPGDWDLRSRIPTMWPWQKRLLQWRVQRIFRASENFNHIERARRFIDHSSPPTLNDSATARYVELVLEGDNPVRAQSPLDVYLPDRPSAAAQRRIADAVEQALLNADTRWAVRATQFLHLAPDHAPRLADALVARLERAELSFVFAGAPQIAPLARHDAHAWTLLMQLLEHESRHIRYYAVGALARMPERRSDAIEIAVSMLTDQDEAVARNALASLRTLAPDICVYAPELWSAGLGGRDIDADVQRILTTRCPESHTYLELLRAELASTDPEILDRALSAIAALFSVSPALADTLRELSHDDRAAPVDEKLAEVLHRFGLDRPPPAD